MYFSSFLNGFQLPKIVSDLRVCLKEKLIFKANIELFLYTKKLLISFPAFINQNSKSRKKMLLLTK